MVRKAKEWEKKPKNKLSRSGKGREEEKQIGWKREKPRNHR